MFGKHRTPVLSKYSCVGFQKLILARGNRFRCDYMHRVCVYVCKRDGTEERIGVECGWQLSQHIEVTAKQKLG